MSTTSTNNFIGAVKDEWQLFSDRPQDYNIGPPIGFGASSVVYAAVYNSPPPEPSHPFPCALKVLDLDSLPPNSLALLQRETQLMSLSKHPNVLRVRGSWIDGHKLYIALRLMNKGSAADIINYAWPGGMEEDVVKCILKQALEGLNYLHINGFIHRDIKAANLLVDDDGTVLIGDLGVAAPLVDDFEQLIMHPTGSVTSNPKFDLPPRPIYLDDGIHPSRPRFGKRKSFVGTPCWMAPELIQGKRYDAKADIWSFGITAIELAQGRPPRSHESPHAVLLQTVQGTPPTLHRVGGTHRYSRTFKEIVDICLAKDPSKRPTAAELLQTPFFKSAKKKPHLVGTILRGLPPLTVRQECRHHPESLATQRTTDSWDFGSTTTSLQAASLVRSSSRIVQKAKTLSITSECNLDDDPKTIGSISEDDSADSQRQATMGPGTTAPFKSEALSPHRPATPIPISRSNGVSAHRDSPSSCSSATPPNLTPLSTPSGFWDKLTRRPPRNVPDDEEFPRGNSISRLVRRRGSSLLALRPTINSS